MWLEKCLGREELKGISDSGVTPLQGGSFTSTYTPMYATTSIKIHSQLQSIK